MYRTRVRLLTAPALLAISVLPLIAGCGGGSDPISSQQNAASAQPFSFGSLIGRAALSSPPITTNSVGATITGLKGNITELTLVDAAPTLAETRIAFVSTRDGNEEIYVMNADGTNQTRVTSNSANDTNPSLSPDGTKIVFESDRNSQHELYVIGVNGTNEKRLTSSFLFDGTPAWSPDGTKIAFVSARNNNREIYVMNADGTNQTRLTNNGYYSNTNPAWSPDSTKIVFISDRTGTSGFWVMNSDGSGLTQIPNNGNYSNTTPVWSPDGTEIAFVSDRDGFSKIFVMAVNGTFVTQLTDKSAFDTNPAWSPDGTKIVFTRSPGGQPRTLYVMNADGTDQAPLISNIAENQIPSWSALVKQRSLIGASGILGANAGGFLVSQRGDTVVNVFTFSAVTPSSLVLTQQTGLNNTGPNLVFSIDADALTRLAYVNNPDFKPTIVVSNTDTSAVKSAVGALVSYNAQTGKVAAILPYNGTTDARSAGRKPSVREEGNLRVFQGAFLGAWDAEGINQAPKGASEVRLDLSTGKLATR